MPWGVGWRGSSECVRGCSPLASRILPGEHEAGSVSADEAREKGREILPPASLGIAAGIVFGPARRISGGQVWCGGGGDSTKSEDQPYAKQLSGACEGLHCAQ
jgi:hypothetical protein